MCLFLGSKSYHRPEFAEKLERLVYDSHIKRLEEPKVHPEIVLVMAGEESLARLGRWPWPRSRHAKLLEKLSLAKVVIFDILFPEPDEREDDLALVSSAQKIDKLVLAMHLTQPKGASSPKTIEPFSKFRDASDALGFANMETDYDGLVRYCKPYRIINGRLIPSLPLAAANTILSKTRSNGKKSTNGGESNPLDHHRLVDANERFWINHGRSEAPVYEYYQVLNGEVPKDVFNDKIVLIGISASGLEDYFKIPTGLGSREISGTQLNCNIIKSLLTEKIPRRVHPLFDGALSMIMVLAGAGLTLINRPIWNFISLFGLVCAVFFLHQYVFVSHLTYTALSLPLSGLMAAFSMFLFIKLKFMHQETEIKTFSITSIIGLPVELEQNPKTYDEYIRFVWDKIEKSTGIQLISPRITWEELKIKSLLNADSHMTTYHEKVIMVEDKAGPVRYLSMIPVSPSSPANEYEYTLLGWQHPISDTYIQAIAAVVLSASWYFQHLKRAEEQKQLLLDTIHAISAAIDAKDPVTGGHSNRVSTIALELADYLNIDQKTKDDIHLGALIHDIGKIGVPDQILLKKGKLTEQEMDTIRMHPTVGKKIMASVKLPEITLQAMHEHHERFDGSGYPQGLKGDQINLAGRILAVADVFDALISKRPYRKAMPEEEALSYMKKKAGVEFDDAVVDALLAILQGPHVPDTGNGPHDIAS